MSEAIEVESIPPLSHQEALNVAAFEYRATLECLGALDAAEWTKPTECPGWDVRTMASHVLAAAESHASMRELVHQMRLGRREEPPLESGIGVVQVRERAALTPTEILLRLRSATDRSIRARRRMPAIVRRIPISYDGLDPPERWRLGYLLDVIYTRDCWMHRIDICRATDRQPTLAAQHDGRLMRDIVKEWGRRYGKTFLLNLEGTTGGVFEHSSGGDQGIEATIDAIEFCRYASGRSSTSAAGLPLVRVPF